MSSTLSITSEIDGFWYDTSGLDTYFSGKKIDLLFVDGPPADTQQGLFARYPAIPFFRPFLADNFSIILDDIERKGETIVASRWAAELGISFRKFLVDGGIALGRSDGIF